MKQLRLLLIPAFAIFVLSFACTISKAQGGIQWSSTSDIATNSFGNLHPRIALRSGGNPVVIWGRSSDESVFISRWTGSAFSMPMKVNPPGFTIATASWMGPDVAAHGDTVFVAMKRTPEATDTNRTFLSRSIDGGLTFGQPVRVDYIADSISRFPVVEVDPQGNPIVGFMKFDPNFGDARWAVTKSTDGGITFGPDAKASGWSGGTVCDCCPGALAVEGNTVCMAYRDNLNNIRDMWAGISTDGGMSFGQGMPIDQGNWMLMNCPSSGPDAVIHGDSLISVYMSQTTGNSLVYLSIASISAAQGAVGQPITGAQSGISAQNFPRIGKHGNAVAAVWRQSFNGMAQARILFTNNVESGFPSTDDSVTMGAMSAVVNVDVAVSDGKVHIVWQDNVTGTVKYREGSYEPFVGRTEPIVAQQSSFAPNPASGLIRLHRAEKAELRVVMYQSDGRKVWEALIPENENAFTVDSQQFAPGIYDVQFQSLGHVATQKLVILPR